MNNYIMTVSYFTEFDLTQGFRWRMHEIEISTKFDKSSPPLTLPRVKSSPLVPHICANESGQIMACCLFCAEPLPKQMQRYCQLDP